MGRLRLSLPLLTLAGLCALCGCAYFNDNFRIVDENKFYRSGQMTGDRLRQVIQENGIRTVVSLRGAAPDETWYTDERAVCEKLDVAHYDLGWSMSTLPSPESLDAFVSILQEENGPVLAHCQGGTHRSGVASAVYLLIQGATVEEARKQFLLFFNDAPIGKLLDLYEGSPIDFGVWVRTEYPRQYDAIENTKEEGAAAVGIR